MSEKLSKAQAAVVRLMESQPDVTWWNRTSLGCRRSTRAALVRRGVLEDFGSADWLFRLVPEAEREPLADEDIPF